MFASQKIRKIVYFDLLKLQNMEKTAPMVSTHDGKFDHLFLSYPIPKFQKHRTKINHFRKYTRGGVLRPSN